jgi:hypothetical protein
LVTSFIFSSFEKRVIQKFAPPYLQPLKAAFDLAVFAKPQLFNEPTLTSSEGNVAARSNNAFGYEGI